MTNKKIPTVSIHGKEYVTVSTRIQMAHESTQFEKLDTEILSHNPVVVKACVTIGGKTFSGISSVSLDSFKQIEKANPYEVAETSAVGRALGFAGYGSTESIASADEMHKSSYTPQETLYDKARREMKEQGVSNEEYDQSVEDFKEERESIPSPDISPDQKIEIARLIPKANLTHTKVNDYIKKWNGKEAVTKLTSHEADQLIERIKKQIPTPSTI